jgi:hypothetical protein
MAEDRLIELLRLLAPAPESWVVEAHEIAAFAPPDDERVDDEDGGAHDQDREDADEGQADFGDVDEPDRGPEDDETDPWSV